MNATLEIEELEVLTEAEREAAKWISVNIARGFISMMMPAIRIVRMISFRADVREWVQMSTVSPNRRVAANYFAIVASGGILKMGILKGWRWRNET